MENKNKWWKDLATDMRVYFVILIIGLLAVVYFCGIRGNNQDNFYYVPEDASVARADTTGKKTVTIQFPHRPNTPIRGINIIKG